jgi:uncharacterized membrane protein YgaE (UPF0421/DUF939 family)
MTGPGKSTLTRSHGLRRELLHAVRTTVAAVASLLIARLCKLPEAYWAAITTMIVMQSTLGAALTISRQRLIGTALGSALGALFARYAGQNVAVFGGGIFLCGIICAVLHMERNAYRYAGITLAIVMLVARTEPAWVIGVHRFVEISLGIVAGLLLTAVWPEPSGDASDH